MFNKFNITAFVLISFLLVLCSCTQNKVQFYKDMPSFEGQHFLKDGDHISGPIQIEQINESEYKVKNLAIVSITNEDGNAVPLGSFDEVFYFGNEHGNYVLVSAFDVLYKGKDRFVAMVFMTDIYGNQTMRIHVYQRSIGHHKGPGNIIAEQGFDL